MSRLIYSKTRSKIAVLLIAVAMLLAAVGTMPTTVHAAGAGVTYSSYDITVSSNPVAQTLVITLHYGAAVSIVTQPNVDILINNTTPVGRNPAVVTASGNDLIITSSPNSGFFSLFQASIEITSDMVGVTVGGASADSIDVGPTIIPLGETVTYTGEGSATVAMSINSAPQVNGMIHVGIYTQTGTLPPYTLTPVSAPTSPLRINTFTVFVDDYTTTDAAALAKAIVYYVGTDPQFPAGYTIAVTGANNDVVTLTAPGNVYMYIVDDKLLKLENGPTGYPMTLTQLQAATPPGKLPNIPNF
jgi:hypothetical protein